MGRKKGQAHKNSKHVFRVEIFNPVTNEWVLKDNFPTIRTAAEALGYSYTTTQNIRLNRNKPLQQFIKITKQIKIKSIKKA